MGLDSTTIPPELTGPTPRRVRASGDWYSTWPLWLFCAIFVILLGRTGIDAIHQSQSRATLRHDNRQVIATVTNFSAGRGGHATVSYTFTLHGAVYTGSAELPHRSAPVFDKSDQIVIRYLPSDPSINHPETWEWSGIMDMDAMLVGIFLAGCGCALFVFSRRNRKLARFGKPALATVIGCTRVDRQFRIDYEFRTEDQAPMKGLSFSNEPCDTGSRLCILYLPQNPSRSTPYPLSGYNILA
jgi:hypothetical protein